MFFLGVWRACEGLGGFGRVWEGLGGFGRAWECLGGLDASFFGFRKTTLLHPGLGTSLAK